MHVNFRTTASVKMLKFPLPSIFILSFLLLACQSENQIFDILNIGYNILKNSDRCDRVLDQITQVWNDLFVGHFYLGNQLNPDVMLKVLGVPEDSLQKCSSLSDGMADSPKCKNKVEAHRSFLDRFHGTTEKINDYLAKIQENYAAVFLTDHALDVKPFELTDSLYEFISDICDDQSTCLFHHLAGKHSLETDIKLIRNPSGISGELYYTYLIIIYHLLKGYATDVCLNEHANLTQMKELSTAKFLMHTHRISKIVISALEGTPRSIVREEPASNSLDSPYLELKWYIGQIIVNEANLNPTGSCWKTCPDYQQTVFHNFGSVPSEGTSICRGTMLNCFHQDLGYICPTTSQSRRYEGIQMGHVTALGNTGTCNGFNGKFANALYYVESAVLDRCDVCTCLCDDHDNPETIRSFSLREVTSDIRNNKVITGLKLTERDGVIYIQIRQGVLVDLSLVKGNQWVNVNAFDKSAFPQDVFTLHYPTQNRVNLDTLSTDDELVRHHIAEKHPNSIFFPNDPYILTGVKFVKQGTRLSFAIGLSSWNHQTRKVTTRQWDNWIFNKNIESRINISMKRSDLPTKTTNHVEYLTKDAYVEFQPSDNIKDFGQSTIPFLDGRPVVTDPAMPLSGAGLFLKGKEGYGGVIGLKLMSIDFSQLVVTELESSK